MTPEEALQGATDLLLSKEYEPILIQALTNAKDVPTGAAVVVAPILLRMVQDGEIPLDEIVGTEEGDGIAVYLLIEVFEIAADAGLIPGGEDPAHEGQEGAGYEAQEGGEEESAEASPEMMQMAQQAVEVLRGLLEKGGAFGQPQGMPAGGPPQAPAGAPMPQAPTDPAQGGGLMRGGGA